jgi:hypothetical protein
VEHTRLNGAPLWVKLVQWLKPWMSMQQFVHICSMFQRLDQNPRFCEVNTFVSRVKSCPMLRAAVLCYIVFSFSLYVLKSVSSVP